MELSITEVGWLTLGAFLLGLAFGGQADFLGFRASLDTGAGELYLTPVAVVSLERMPISGHKGATTLGGTILATRFAAGLTPQGTLLEGGAGWAATLRYEMGHVDRWMAYGLEYPLHVLAEPCAHDPGYAWFGAVCPSLERTQAAPPPVTGALRLAWR